MPGPTDFAKMVPGFDFLQGLLKNAGGGLPAIGQWIAPTLDPEELGKRIEQLRTVQFWLEQNAKMLGATIQALEVQRMTLSTLRTMNLPVDALRDAVQARPPEAAAAAKAPRFEMPSAMPPGATTPAPAPAPARPRAKAAAAAAKAAAPAAPAVDPMQWWGALTQQFTELATQALKDGGGAAAKQLAGAMVQQSIDAANQTLKTVSAAPGKAVRAAGEVVKAATAPPRRAAPRKAAAAAPAGSGAAPARGRRKARGG